MLTREFFDAGIVFVPCMSLATGALTVWVVPRPFEVRATPFGEPGQLALVVGLCALAAYLLTGNAAGACASAAAAGALSLGLKAWLPRLTMVGALEMAQQPLAFLMVTPWTYLLLRDLAFPPWALTLVLVGVPLAATGLAVGWSFKLARQALITHGSWRRPTKPLPPRTGAAAPKVSIHLPCYAEPPEVVIATIDSLARLDYANFEVLVCDNNTADEALWRPLAAHCARLNERAGTETFRFFHVAPLSGAKAGALNFCLEKMASDAELVAVIDADYVAEPDFLARLVGFFDNPKIGYVQAPHDYREFDYSRYLRTCYWNYMPAYKTDFASINEYNASFTVGTMCILRRSALIEAGGWSEWCLTEDSEVSIRLRALGYEGVYLYQTFGRGLIPETFEDFKKQRFRWTAGPIQQIHRYWRLFLPRPFGVPSGLGGWSKLLEITQSLMPFFEIGSAFMAISAGVLVVALTINGALPSIVVPPVAWVALGLAAAAYPITSAQRFRLAGGTRLTDLIAAGAMGLALTYIRMAAAVAVVSRRPLKWRRTPKFKAKGTGLRAIGATTPELCIGLAILAIGHACWLFYDEIGLYLALGLSAGATVLAARFLAAPLMALLSEWQLAAAQNAGAPSAPGPLSSLPAPAAAPALRNQPEPERVL